MSVLLKYAPFLGDGLKGVHVLHGARIDFPNRATERMPEGGSLRETHAVEDSSPLRDKLPMAPMC